MCAGALPPHRAVNGGHFMATGTRGPLHTLLLAGISCRAASPPHVTDIFLIHWQRTFENQSHGHGSNNNS